MSKESLPKTGTGIPVEKFHVSECNIRHAEEFGRTEKDQNLINQIALGKTVVQVFKARPEPGGYGVFVGRRRYLSKAIAKMKKFTVGSDYIKENTVYLKEGARPLKEAAKGEFIVGADVSIEDLGEEEARRQSLIENLDLLREETDPITRAHELAKLVDSAPDGLRGEARRLGISPSTLSEWLKVLELSPKMQETVSKGKLFYTDALHLAKMDLGTETQDKLAETLETEGMEAFQKELERHAEKGLKRGIPKGKYEILRITFDRVYPPDVALYEKLKKLAEGKHQEVDEYAKAVLQEHVKA
jgi:ParB-like chromosome segregation protein Spo0J